MNKLWQIWKAPVGKIAAFVIILILWAARMGFHFFGELPEKLQISLLAFLGIMGVEQLFQLVEQGRLCVPPKTYRDFPTATIPMEELIISEGTAARGRSVKIQFLGVGMHMGHEWVTSTLHQITADNPSLRLQIEICMVSPEFLRARSFDKTVVNWPELASAHLQNYKDLVGNRLWSCEGRFEISAVYVYDNLPQSHGILINDQYLFGSSCDFGDHFAGNLPKPYQFRAGLNKYCFYQRGDSIFGAEKITEFKNWFGYYSQTASQKIVSPLAEPTVNAV